MNDVSLAEEILSAYAELDAELAGIASACRACGRCCDFSTHEERLYASGPEREVLCLAGTPPEASGGETCPYLQKGKCAARRYRPLGCRTYFCETDAGAAGRELYEKYRARIAALATAAGAEWDYRPVLECLAGRPGSASRGGRA